MNRNRSLWMFIAFVAAFLAVGIPYWQIPYSKVNLPSTLLGASLWVVAAGALLLRWHEAATLWRVTGVMMASVPMAVFARVVVEGFKDPTSHNLWPFEIIIALALGFCWALGGSVVGSVLAKLFARRPSGGAS